MVSSQYAVNLPRTADEPHEILRPVIVVKGKPLFNASTDAQFELSHKQIGSARLLYKIPNDMAEDYAVDVVHLNDMAAFIEAAAQTAEGIFQAHAHQVYWKLHQRALDADNRRLDRPRRGSNDWMTN